VIKLNSYKLFVKRIGLLGIANFLVALNTIILIPILTKNFSASDYGIWIQVLTTFFLITSIVNLGLPYTMVRFLSAEKDKDIIQEGFYSMATLILIISFFVSLFIFIFSKGIAGALFNNDIGVVKVISIIIFFGTLNSLFIDFFVAFGQMKRYSLLLLFQTYFSLALITYFAVTGQGILMVVIGFLITQIVLFLVMFVVIFHEIGFKVPKFDNIKEYLNFSLPIIPNNLSTWIVESSDRYVIGIILGTAFVGFYSPGYTLGMAILLFFTPLSILLSSILPKHYENGNMDEVMVYINYSLKYFLLVAIPSFFILSLLSKPIMMIITTPEIALNGYQVTPFIAFSALLFGSYGIIMNLIILEKKTKIIGSIWTIAALISLLNILLVPIFGILAAAAVTLLSYLTAFLISMNYSRKFFIFHFDYSFILKSIFASILMSIIIILVNPKGFISVIILIIICSTIYLLLIFAMKGINRKEIDFFRSMIKLN
jgi:O-antigen/teichoic acid export membrane protein